MGVAENPIVVQHSKPGNSGPFGLVLHFPKKHRTCGDWARRRERRFFDTDR